METTVIIPALNEEKTISEVISQIQNVLKINKIKGTILVVDNNSTDNTKKIAESLGAKVITELKQGYGAAIIAGINKAKTEYCIMLDADCSYDIEAIPDIIKALKNADLVIGNRYKGGIRHHAMPLAHKYIGTPIISFIGRVIYKNNIWDYNCGMRGFNTKAIQQLNLLTPGMEFASEMIAAATLNHLKIMEIPIKYFCDKREKSGHLRSIPDGIKHLKVLLSYKLFRS